MRVVSGMGRRKEPDPGSLPEPGERVTFTLFELTARQSAPLPDPEDTPWTHGGPPNADPGPSLLPVPGPMPGTPSGEAVAVAAPTAGAGATASAGASDTATEEWE